MFRASNPTLIDILALLSKKTSILFVFFNKPHEMKFHVRNQPEPNGFRNIDIKLMLLHKSFQNNISVMTEPCAGSPRKKSQVFIISIISNTLTAGFGVRRCFNGELSCPVSIQNGSSL
jgi:hypothetical protein